MNLPKRIFATHGKPRVRLILITIALLCTGIFSVFLISQDARRTDKQKTWSEPEKSQEERGTVREHHKQIRSVGMNDVRWTDGFWAEKFELLQKSMVPAMREALRDPNNAAQLQDLEVAAGLKDGKHQGHRWGDGDVYKYFETLSWVYSVTENPELDKRLDKWIGIIDKAQCPDGYISTNRGCDPDRRWVDVEDHELYNMGHLISAAVVHHRATGKTNFLELAEKTADYLVEVFMPTPKRLMNFPRNPSILMALEDLYEVTGKKAYLELAKVFVHNRGRGPGGTDAQQDRVPLKKETMAVGHGVWFTYLHSGAVDLYKHTGDRELLDATLRLWRDVASTKTFLHGGIGAGHGQSPRGDRIPEGFRGAYDLPENMAYSETCANIGHAMWNYRLLNETGRARFADTMERVFYNSMLSGMDVDGNAYFYCNPMAWHGDSNSTRGNRMHVRQKTLSCWCCPPNLSRKLASLHTKVYGVSEDALWVHLFGGSVVDTELPDGSPISVEQKTEYPWKGTVTLEVKNAPDRNVALKVRIPDWAKQTDVALNGNVKFRSPEPGSYMEIQHNWKQGDRLVLTLPLRVRKLEAHPNVKNLRDKVALMRGPLVYAVEFPQKNNGKKKWKNGVFLPANARFTPEHRADVLGGATVLNGQALTFDGRETFREMNPPLPSIPDRPSWDDSTLYREVVWTEPDLNWPEDGRVDLSLIPYHLWANRGVSYMEVWIPLARSAQD